MAVSPDGEPPPCDLVVRLLGGRVVYQGPPVDQAGGADTVIVDVSSDGMRIHSTG